MLHLKPVVAPAVSSVIRGVYFHSLFPGLFEFLELLDKFSGFSISRYYACGVTGFVILKADFLLKVMLAS